MKVAVSSSAIDRLALTVAPSVTCGSEAVIGPMVAVKVSAASTIVSSLMVIGTTVEVVPAVIVTLAGHV